MGEAGEVRPANASAAAKSLFKDAPYPARNRASATSIYLLLRYGKPRRSWRRAASSYSTVPGCALTRTRCRSRAMFGLPASTTRPVQKTPDHVDSTLSTPWLIAVLGNRCGRSSGDSRSPGRLRQSVELQNLESDAGCRTAHDLFTTYRFATYRSYQSTLFAAFPSTRLQAPI